MKLDELVNSHYSQLNENDLYIWNYISSHRKECEKLAIDQLAFKCCVSRTTVLRFAQKLSLKGYGELKVFLKLDNQEAKENIGHVDMVCHSYQQVIDSMKEKDCTEILKVFDQAKNIYVYGIGMIQSSIKKELKRTFMMSGRLIYDLSGYEEAEKLLSLVTEDDLFIIISVSGENEFINNFTKNLKIRGVPVLSITKLRENTLAHMADYALYVTDTVFSQPFSQIEYDSLTSYFILIEILFLKYMEYQTNKEEKADETGETD